MSGDLDSLRVLIKSLSDRVTAQDEIIAELRRNAAESNDQILALSRKIHRVTLTSAQLQRGKFRMVEFSDEVILRILEFCSSARDMVALSTTCKRIFPLLMDETLWKLRFLTVYGPTRHQREVLADVQRQQRRVKAGNDGDASPCNQEKCTILTRSELTRFIDVNKVMRRWKGDAHKAMYSLEFHKGSVTALIMTQNRSCRGSSEYDIMYASSDDGSISCWEVPCTVDEEPEATSPFEPAGDGDERPPPGLALMRLVEGHGGGPRKERSGSFSYYPNSCSNSSASPITIGAGAGLHVRTPMRKVSRIKSYHGHAGAVWCLAHDRRTEQLVTGSCDTTVKLWDSHTGSCVRTLRGHTGWVYALAITAAGLGLGADASDDSAPLAPAISASSSSFSASRGGVVRLVTASWDKTVRLWDPSLPDGTPDTPTNPQGQTRAGCLLRSLTAPHDMAGLYSVSLDDSLGAVLAGTWSAASATPTSGPVHAGATIVHRASEGLSRVCRWDLESGQALAPLSDPGITGPVYSMQVLEGGRRVLAACGQCCTVFDQRTRQSTGLHLVGHDKSVMCAQSYAGGFLCMTGSYDCTARLWDMRKPTAALAVYNEREPVLSLRYDDRRLITGTAGRASIKCRFF